MTYNPVGPDGMTDASFTKTTRTPLLSASPALIGMVGLSASELQAETLFPGDTIEYFSIVRFQILISATNSII